MQTARPPDNEAHRSRQELESRAVPQDIELRFFEMSLDMMCTASLDTGHFMRLNSRWSRTLGHTDDELYAQPFIEFVHPEDRAATLAAASELASGKNVVSFTNRYRTKPGDYRWLEWMSTVNLEQRLIYAVARDVTTRKAAEEALRQLATPVIPLADEVIAIPLIGDIDPARAQQLIEITTREVRIRAALVVLIDLTGVRQLDSHGASALLRVAQATRLLGSISVFTGIGPNIAQTLVGLDIELRNLVTYRTLQEGIEFAFRFAREARLGGRSASARRLNC